MEKLLAPRYFSDAGLLFIDRVSLVSEVNGDRRRRRRRNHESTSARGPGVERRGLDRQAHPGFPLLEHWPAFFHLLTTWTSGRGQRGIAGGEKGDERNTAKGTRAEERESSDAGIHGEQPLLQVRRSIGEGGHAEAQAGGLSGKLN